MGTIDLNLLEVFAAVGQTASFSAASRLLKMPKSSVSRSISALEKQMGVRLLHRTTRHVAMSTAGVALFDRVTPLLASLQTAVGELPELGEEPSGQLRVTTSVDIGDAVLPEIVARFVTRHPAVELDLRITNSVLDLVAEGIDIGLRISIKPLKDSSLSARKAGTLVAQLFATPSYLARRGTPKTPADLSEHDWVRFEDEPLSLEGPGGPVSVPLHTRIHADDVSCVRATVAEGVGIGVLPTFLVAHDVAAGRLVRVLPRWNMPTGFIWLVTPSARNLPRKTVAFRDLAAEVLKQRFPAPA